VKYGVLTEYTYIELYKQYDSSILIYKIMRSWWQAGTLFFIYFVNVIRCTITCSTS